MENIIELEYDKPVEVTKTQLKEMMRLFNGIITGREDQETGKCYIKIWMMKYKPQVELYLRKSDNI